MNLWAAAALALMVILVLFAVATIVERRSQVFAHMPRLRFTAYVLSLGVYCSSWTFYGSVGSAARDGWAFLPIYLGPLLLLVGGKRFLTRLAHAVAGEQASTVSDFIAARFGHDVRVAQLVTLIALLGSIPYIALQFSSISNALAIASGHRIAAPIMVAMAASLALFAILFGARRFELTGRNEGLVYAIGLESLIKLLAMTGIATVAVVSLMGANPARLAIGVSHFAHGFAPRGMRADVAVIMLTSLLAIIVLPRQFYMGLVEAGRPADLPDARTGLAAYIGAMALLILPIALAGTVLLGSHVSPDLYVLALPGATGHGWALALALIGGIGAASSMVIVDSTALATMVSNDLIFPTLIRGAGSNIAGIGQRILLIRRLTIIAILALAMAWALLDSRPHSLASMGVVAFAAMAQFSPHLILATRRTGHDPIAARASLTTGLLLWLYTLALPPILPVSWLAFLGGTFADPQRLFGLSLGSPLVHGVVWSLGVNLIVLAAIAARNVSATPLIRPLRSSQQVKTIADLARMTVGFVGEERVAREFPHSTRAGSVDRRSALRAQELIATVIGASPARALVASALTGGQMSITEVTQLLGEGGQSLRFSRHLLAATFENLDAGISVVDSELNLIAWNSRYLDIFQYPPGLVHTGVHIADLIRHNARKGDFGPVTGDTYTEQLVTKRLEHLRRGKEHHFERRRADGRVIKTVGGPMPGGGYVMSFTDITSEAHARDALEHTLTSLEERVAERTAALSKANNRLEAATRDKTRFLAAASHDLLQPLHAARLFTAALAREVSDKSKRGLTASELVERVDRSIIAAENLLRALLDISRLDAGGVQPEPEVIDLGIFLHDIADSIRPMASANALRLHVVAPSATVRTDPALLRSIIQNFLTNAIRYTPQGGVLLGARRIGNRIAIDVVDTGIGIADDQRAAIFREFARVGELDTEGIGLGLALVERLASLLNGEIALSSMPGKGSRFRLFLNAHKAPSPPQSRFIRPAATAPIRALDVLIIDNQRDIVEASVALLERLGHRGHGAYDYETAKASLPKIDAVLADYHLDRDEDGLSVIASLRSILPNLPAALITAVCTPDITARARSQSVSVLTKPASAEVIESFLHKAAAATRQI